MAKKILFICLSVLLLASCNSKSSKEEQPEVIRFQSSSASNIPILRQAIQLNALDGYFSVYKPSETKVYILDKSNFEKNFHAAATVDNRPRMIDFEREGAGAIVLPETEYETEIILDSAYVSNNTMHIIYTINKGVEKRSFTILPVKIFTFEKSLGIDSISFNNNGVSIIIPNSDI